MSREGSAQSAKAAAILEPEQLEAYRKVLGFLEQQMELVQRARAALEQAEFVARCVDAERIRVWRELCEAHGLDPEVDYVVDEAGRVFEK